MKPFQLVSAKFIQQRSIFTGSDISLVKRILNVNEPGTVTSVDVTEKGFAYAAEGGITHVEGEGGFHGAELVHLGLDEAAAVRAHGRHGLRLPV